MDISHLTSAPWEVQLHTYCAITAFTLGVVQLVAPKGSLPHKTLGSIWIAAMITVAATSIVIRPAILGYDLPLLSWFSPIHLLTALTIWGLFQGISAITIKGKIVTDHAKHFKSMFLFGLVIAGGFTLLPGRMMYRIFFGP